MHKKITILDGALGTELERRGFDARLPLWSARAVIEAPEWIVQIHRDYVEAGAQVLTAATFRTTRHSLAKEGLELRAEELSRKAVSLARKAIAAAGALSTGDATGTVAVAGSVAPLEDCYLPELAPAEAIMAREFTHICRTLADAGADLLLVETQNSQREAWIATEAAIATGLPVWLSLMPQNAVRLFNGDPLVETAVRASDMGAEAILLNCCIPSVAEAAFQSLRDALPRARLGVYPNFGSLIEGQFSHLLSPAAFADWGTRMIGQGAAIIGGCCGTTPDHIRALSISANVRGFL